MMDCCFHNAPPGGCNSGRDCPLRQCDGIEPWHMPHTGNQPNDAALSEDIALAQMPGSIEPAQAMRGGVPFKTRAGVVVGGAYVPPKSIDYADPIRVYRSRSFFRAFIAWLLS